MDYTTRAIRDEELKLVKERQEEGLTKHKEMYEKDTIQKAEQNKKDWETAIERKNALSSLNVFHYMGEFESKITTREESKYEAIKVQCKKDAKQLAESQKLKRARNRKEAAIEAEREKARLAELEAIRLEKEMEAEKAKEEEARQKEDERLAEDRQKLSSTKFIPSVRSNRFGDRDSDRGSGNRFGNRDSDPDGGSRFGDRGGGSRFGDRSSNLDRDSDRGGGSRYVPPALRNRTGGGSRPSETQHENSRWR